MSFWFHNCCHGSCLEEIQKKLSSDVFENTNSCCHFKSLMFPRLLPLRILSSHYLKGIAFSKIRNVVGKDAVNKFLAFCDSRRF